MTLALTIIAGFALMQIVGRLLIAAGNALERRAQAAPAAAGAIAAAWQAQQEAIAAVRAGQAAAQAGTGRVIDMHPGPDGVFRP
jgi:hypothetical protein